MTITISVSVNGNYKVPVTVDRGDGQIETEIVSGYGHSGPNTKHIYLRHGVGEIVNVSVGPEEADDGASKEPPADNGGEPVSES